MQETINIIKEWPTIIQGALGSALFWLILIFSEKLFVFLSKKYSIHSKKSRKTWIINRMAAIGLSTAKTNESQIYFIIGLGYRSSRFLFKALMWLTLGLIFQTILQPLSIIGFIGCLYYLIKGYNVVKGTEENEEELLEELKSLKSELHTLRNS